MENSRTINSLKNSSSSIVAYILLILTTFVSQTFFIKILGREYLGLNGLFSNILSMLSLFELGVGSAIVYNLYEPISNNNEEKIKSLMLFYKKAYRFIAVFILICGLCILPFLSSIVEDITINVNIKTAYILMLASTVSSYFLSFKRSILYASQNDYIINIIHSIYLIILNVVHIIVLIISHNYYLFIIVKIIFQLLENIIITIICNKKYPYLRKNGKELARKEKHKIFTKMKAIMYHKIGGILVFSTDNLIINKYFGVVYVGLYSNYNLIINSINNLVCKFIESIIPSVGNLIANKEEEKIYDIFKKTKFLNFWISSFTSVSILLLINPFITLWLGKDYLLNKFTVFILILCYFQKTERYSYTTFKNASGIWEADKYIPIFEALINIITSIIFVKVMGLAGVFVGTITSGLIWWFYGYPIFIYKPLFNKKCIVYYKELFKRLLIFLIIIFISLLVSNYLNNNDNVINFFINFLISLIIPNALLLLIYRNCNDLKYFINFIKKIKIKK